jgi:uncharacterized protein with FMN-binding domain
MRWPVLESTRRSVEDTDSKEVYDVKPIRIRQRLVLLAGTAALTSPVVAADAAAQHSITHRVAGTKTAKFTGATAPAHQWGTVTVIVTQQTTTLGKKVTRKFTDLGGGYTYHTSRSQFIMSQALPLLRQEFLVAQSANIHMVSGATYTSQAFVRSLQSALLKAHA